MYTIIETQQFQRKANAIWQEGERLDFFSYIAKYPLDGDVIRNANGLRKIRWQANGKSKRGGVRVIYFNLLDEGIILMLDLYAKNEKENLSSQDLKVLKGQKNG